MAIRSFERKEIKFLLRETQYQSLLESVAEYMNPDKYCGENSEYGVYNIYLDTEDNHLIRTSLEKPRYKEKLRLRTYNSPAAYDSNVFLEIKKKIYGVVTKRRVTMTLAEAEEYLSTGIHPVSEKYIQNQVFDEIDSFLQRYTVSPKQYISYTRSAWFGKYDGTFRLTFDRNITSRRNDLTLHSSSYGEQLIGADEHLMEVKIKDTMPLWLAEKLTEIGVSKLSFSKYGRAYKKYILSPKEPAIVAAAI